MKRLKTLLYVASMSCVALIQGVDAFSQNARDTSVRSVKSDELKFSATIAKRFSAGENVSLLLEVENIGKNVIAINDDVTRTFVITLRTMKGEPAPKTQYGYWLDRRPKDVGRNVIIRLVPKRRASVIVDLGLIFDVTLGDAYSAVIECEYSKDMKEPKRIRIDGLSFTVNGASLRTLNEQNP